VCPRTGVRHRSPPEQCGGGETPQGATRNLLLQLIGEADRVCDRQQVDLEQAIADVRAFRDTFVTSALGRTER
jgi:hypothetical protein